MVLYEVWSLGHTPFGNESVNKVRVSVRRRGEWMRRRRCGIKYGGERVHRGCNVEVERS